LDTSDTESSGSENVPSKITSKAGRRRADDDDDDLIEGLLTRSGDVIEDEEDDLLGDKTKFERIEKETMSSSSGRYGAFALLQKQLREMKERKTQGGGANEGKIGDLSLDDVEKLLSSEGV
jgi:hypothetical protein